MDSSSLQSGESELPDPALVPNAYHQLQAATLQRSWSVKRKAMWVLGILIALAIPTAIILNSMGINPLNLDEGLGEQIVIGKPRFGKGLAGQGFMEIRDEVYYTRKVGVEDANKLIDFLKKEQFFGHPNGSTSQLSKADGVFLISFIVQDGVWDKQEFVDSFGELRQALEKEVFQAPVEVRLCHREIKRTDEGRWRFAVRRVIR